MRKIKLINLSLTNFRGIKELSIEPQGQDISILGANSTGKSTTKDAFLWLLFGKDAEGRKDHNIKRYEGGQELRKTDAVVEATLSVNGELITLKRTFREVWRKPHGQTEQVFDGHETLYHYNGVPLKQKDYNARIAELVGEEEFKIITSISQFFSMHWEKQREVLLSMAGTISDEEIAQRDERFSALLGKLSGKSFKDYRAEVAEKKRRFKKDLSEIQPRIDQTEKMKPNALDWDDIEAQIGDLDAKISRANVLIEDANQKALADNAARSAALSEIEELKGKRQAILQQKIREAQDDAFRRNQAHVQLTHEITLAESALSGKTAEMETTTKRIEEAQKKIESIKASQASLREQWHKVNAETYPEYGHQIACPHCGSVFDADPNHETAKASWQERKSASLQRITEEGQAYNGQFEEQNGIISNMKASLEAVSKSAEELAAKIEALKAQKQETPVVQPAEVKAEDIQEIQDLDRLLDDKQANLPEQASAPDTSATKAQRAVWIAERDQLKLQLKGKEDIAKAEKEIAKLEKQGSDLAQQIADLEGHEFIISEFSKVRINECEARINSMFSMVKFKMFDTTNEGNEFETCIPMVNGVPYSTANTADKANAGLDIINTLSRYYGISAPIFFDGRESVTHIIPTEAQIINLIVSPEHKQLTTQ
ncbi:MAG: AAA family ATPase [Porphyromonadaceae bacterium]|nr:AAA family ATPase [Porphyromonadaceae bacterium]